MCYENVIKKQTAKIPIIHIPSYPTLVAVRWEAEIT